MNFKTTLVLLVLTAVGGVTWFYWEKVAPHVGLAPKAANPNGAGSPEVLEKLARDKIRSVKIQNGAETVVLEKTREGTWALPGKWPTRKAEAEELIDQLGKLHSRFAVIPFDGPDQDLKPFGLDPSQNPVSVTIDGDEPARILLGEADSSEGGVFARPTYARINDKPEIVRLGPDILPILKHPREYYQRRQLFPESERVKFAESRAASPFGPTPDASTGPVAIPRARQIVLEGPQGKVVLKNLNPDENPAAYQTAASVDPVQLAERWQIVEPVVDRPEPEKLKALLTAIPNLWVESFDPKNEKVAAAAALAAVPGGGLPVSVPLAKIASESGDSDWLKKQSELDNPKYKISVTLPSGDVVTLNLGKVSHTSERPGQPPPQRPGMPPMPPMPIREEFRYAQLAGQPIIFEVKADKLSDLFVAANALRDERLARFKASDVTRVEIKHKDATIVLTREKDEKKSDKWKVEQPIQALGESSKIIELLDKLETLEAREPDVLDKANLKDAGLEPPAIEVKLALTEELPATKPGAEKTKRDRTVVYAFGAPAADKLNPMAKKVNVRVQGRERVNLVDESAVKLAERPALAYRGRRVLDFETSQVAKLDVKLPKESFTLQHTNGDWKLTAPVTAEADKLKAGDLAGDLGRLEAVEYVNDAPAPFDLLVTGLLKPELAATVTLSEQGSKPQTLLVGRQRETKPEYFAKLEGGTSIFVIRKDLRDRIEKSSLDYRPMQLWTLMADQVTNLKVERPADSYELKREGFNWKIVKPFDAPVGFAQVVPLVDAIAQLKLAGYQAHTAPNPAEFGLDKPQVKLTFTAPEKAKEGAEEKPRERTLILGKKVPDKPEVYAKLADDPAVFKVAESVVLSTNKPALDLLDHQLINIGAGRMTKIERDGAEKMTLTQAMPGWKVTAGSVSFPADPPTVASTFQAWETLAASKYAAYGPGIKFEEFGLKPAAETLTITANTEPGGQPEKHTLKLGKPADDGGRYAQVDDKPAVAVLPAATVRVLTRGHLDYADKSLLSVDEAGIQSIKRTMKDNNLEITRPGGWKIVKPSEQKADEPSLDDWMKSLAVLRAEKVAAYEPKDLKPFGLDNPAAVVTITVEKDGKPTPHVLKIGAPADAKAPDGERYVAVEGSKVVGVLAIPDARKLLAGAIAFRDKALVKRLAEPDKVVLERGERKATFAKVDGTWKMTEPISAEAEHADLEDFVNALFKLRADELVAEKPAADKLKEYGLDKPAMTWKFLAGDKEALALIIGKRDSTDQRVYAKLGGQDLVVLLTPPVTVRATAEYRKRSLLAGFDAAQAETLAITTDAGRQVLHKVGGAWQLDGKPDAKIKQEAVTDLLGVLANLKVDHFVRDKDAPKDLYGLGKPKRVITVQGPMGAPQELHLGNFEGTSKRAYAALPGKSEVFTLSEADTAKLTAEVK
jgi:hypothetical protein